MDHFSLCCLGGIRGFSKSELSIEFEEGNCKHREWNVVIAYGTLKLYISIFLSLLNVGVDLILTAFHEEGRFTGR